MSDPPLPSPPLALLERTGFLGPRASAGSYDAIGADSRKLVEAMLPADWTWPSKRVLDFGCGVGKVLRHFAAEAALAEFTGCDIHEPSVDWIRRNLCPPFSAFVCSAEPALPYSDDYFDLIYAFSVYTHLDESWAAWLLEHHRVLAEDGLLLVSFLGEGMLRPLTGEQWDERLIGMNTLWAGKPWDQGGPIVFHSPWWLQAHWGRAFDVVRIVPHTGEHEPEGHGLILLRKKAVELTVEDLTRPEPREHREISALAHHVHQLRQETLQLRAENQALSDIRAPRWKRALGAVRQLARVAVRGAHARDHVRR
jgi:SAM-dependent methyltransferase